MVVLYRLIRMIVLCLVWWLFVIWFYSMVVRNWVVVKEVVRVLVWVEMVVFGRDLLNYLSW